jgi:hypothetical protein
MTSLLTSIGLGVGAGVNAYATLLVFGLLSRLRPGMFEGEMATFFASTPVLIGLGVLYTIEFLADKIPALDHIWDVVHTFIRPAAGALVAWAATAHELPKGWVILASVLAGGAALTSHVAKSSLRVASTATTAGAANPVLSLTEDLFAFVNAIVAIFLPALVALVIVLVVILFLILMRRYRKRESF